MSPTTEPSRDAQRAGVRRTVWILVACALAAYGLFLYSAFAGK
jgi:hypothetical protein